MKNILATLILATASFTASAQQVTLDSGVKTGTYYQLVNEMIATCATDGSVVNKEQPGGSPATITDIAENKAAGGLVQFDVLWMRSRNQDLTNIKTLFPMHREQVHIVVKNKDIKSGGVLGFGGKTTVLTDIRNLKGLPVAAQGGSIYTAQALNQLSGIGFLIQSDYKDTEAVKQAIIDDKVAAAIIVGGAPMETIKKLDKRFKLLPVDPATAEKIKDVYRPKSVVYENLSTTGTPTVEVDALLVVNNYKSAKMSQVLNTFRSCIKENIDDLRETPGNHAAWRSAQVDSAEKARWDVYVGKQ